MTNVTAIKAAARGRWAEIISSIGGIAADVLDGRHHPCPRCGGKDRFRALDDFAETGAVFCNQCFNQGNGDGIAALEWLTCEPFKVVGGKLTEYLGVNNNGHKKRNGKLVDIYSYNHADGALSYQVCRFEPKDFRQRQPKPDGGWSWSIKGVQRIPYHLDRLVTSDSTKLVCVPEGEKDVDRLLQSGAGLIATCNSGGAGKWDAAWGSKYFSGRHIVILPDNDQPGRDHAKDVAVKLFDSAASIKIIELPELPEKGDVSDWLDAGHTTDELLALVDKAQPVTASQIDSWIEEARDTTTPLEDDGKDLGQVKMLADAICLTDHFAQDAGGRLYRYSNGVFLPDGEQHIKVMVKTLLTAWGRTKRWTSRLASEVVEFIHVDAPELPDRPRMDLVNVENGMVRIEDGAILPHDPKYLSVVQLPVKYDPAATCPNIEAFVAATFPADAHSLAWEITGILMVPATWLQKAVLLLGEGANGKSVWLSLLVRFLGRPNVASIPLHRLETDRFVTARLVGKLANVCADLPSEHLAGTSVFKAIVGGDTLPAEHKFKDSFDVTPFVRLVFSANHAPRSADSSAAFFRRWVVVPFDHTFGPDEQIPRDILDARLQASEELSGLLNRALEGLRRVQQQRGFSEPASVQAAWRDFHATTDPLAVWLDRYTIDDPDAIVPKQTIRVAYNAQVEREGRPAMTAKGFGQALYKLRPNIEEKQRMVGGRLQWCYVGIGMAQQGVNSLNSLDSRNPSLLFIRTEKSKGIDDSGNSVVGIIEGNPVNPVNVVNADDCTHSNVVETPTHDGYVNLACRDCGTPLGCRKQEQTV